MADVTCPNTPFWREKLYAESHNGDEDARFFTNALKSGFIEGKMGAREMTFGMNMPPVRAVGSAP